MLLIKDIYIAKKTKKLEQNLIEIDGKSEENNL